MKKELTCIICPMGCALEAECETDADGMLTVLSVAGNTCPRGERYARAELTHPTRTVTSTVTLTGARHRRLPVITSEPVPRERVMDVCREIRRVSVCAPVKIHDIIIENVCGLGVSVIASRSMQPYDS
ncbi:MAG: DUF1667 domain-containing protein [Lachnospiraceae bacterium]|jgi:CxxC motif-containing protein|nr:DUF1667 domain-containing protein [Lachnospiraceae bacterium]